MKKPREAYLLYKIVKMPHIFVFFRTKSDIALVKCIVEILTKTDEKLYSYRTIFFYMLTN